MDSLTTSVTPRRERKWDTRQEGWGAEACQSEAVHFRILPKADLSKVLDYAEEHVKSVNSSDLIWANRKLQEILFALTDFWVHSENPFM